jgi:hypothetical protein
MVRLTMIKYLTFTSYRHHVNCHRMPMAGAGTTTAPRPPPLPRKGWGDSWATIVAEIPHPHGSAGAKATSTVTQAFSDNHPPLGRQRHHHADHPWPSVPREGQEWPHTWITRDTRKVTSCAAPRGRRRPYASAEIPPTSQQKAYLSRTEDWLRGHRLTSMAWSRQQRLSKETDGPVI